MYAAGIHDTTEELSRDAPHSHTNVLWSAMHLHSTVCNTMTVSTQKILLCYSHRVASSMGAQQATRKLRKAPPHFSTPLSLFAMGCSISSTPRTSYRSEMREVPTGTPCGIVDTTHYGTFERISLQMQYDSDTDLTIRLVKMCGIFGTTVVVRYSR